MVRLLAREASKSDSTLNSSTRAPAFGLGPKSLGYQGDYFTVLRLFLLLPDEPLGLQLGERHRWEGVLRELLLHGVTARAGPVPERTTAEKAGVLTGLEQQLVLRLIDSWLVGPEVDDSPGVGGSGLPGLTDDRVVVLAANAVLAVRRRARCGRSGDRARDRSVRSLRVESEELVDVRLAHVRDVGDHLRGTATQVDDETAVTVVQASRLVVDAALRVAGRILDPVEVRALGSVALPGTAETPPDHGFLRGDDEGHALDALLGVEVDVLRAAASDLDAVGLLLRLLAPGADLVQVA